MRANLTSVMYRQLLKAAKDVSRAQKGVSANSEVHKRMFERISYWESYSFGGQSYDRTVEEKAAEMLYVHEKAAADASTHPEMLIKHAFRSPGAESSQILEKDAIELCMVGLRELSSLRRQLLICGEWSRLLSDVEEQASLDGLSVEERGLALLMASRDDSEPNLVYRQMSSLLGTVVSDIYTVHQGRRQEANTDEETGFEEVEAVLRSINAILFTSRGLVTSNRPHGACIFLDAILELRQSTEANPVALASLYKSVARRCGLELTAISLPDIPEGWHLSETSGKWLRPGFDDHNSRGIIPDNFHQKVLLTMEHPEHSEGEETSVIVIDVAQGGNATVVAKESLVTLIRAIFGPDLVPTAATLPIMTPLDCWRLCCQHLVKSYATGDQADMQLHHVYANILCDLHGKYVAQGEKVAFEPRTTGAWLAQHGGASDFYVPAT